MSHRFRFCTSVKTFTPVMIAGLLCLAAAQRALAQVDQGAINGTVSDSSGSVIAGATVRLTNDATGLTFTRSTNNTGFYTFTPIKIGSYTISVAAPNFAAGSSQKKRRQQRCFGLGGMFHSWNSGAQFLPGVGPGAGQP